jgi:Flp pilus assembly protein TadG
MDRNGRSAGQAMAETAILMPVFLFILGASFTGSQMLSSVISVDGAARAGVIAYVAERDEKVDADNDAAADGNQSPPSLGAQLADATAAVNNEEGCVNCFVAVADAAHCLGTSNCVWVTQELGTRQGHNIAVVHVARYVASYIPVLGNHTITAQAGLEP